MTQYYHGDNNWPEIGVDLQFDVPISTSFETPADYLPDSGLVAAVNTALMLGQPLLLTGEPGTGKTQLAYHVARRLGLLRPIKYEVKSTTETRDLFYSVDSLRQFRDYSIKEKNADMNYLEYIEFQALGLAILRAADPQTTAALAHKIAHKEKEDLWDDNTKKIKFPHRSVVLIDEIDKAPRDIPNDLLNEIENLYFKIPELRDQLGGTEIIRAENTLRPIVIFTSNSEKNLPDAFLRRCVYYNISFPSREDLQEIINRRMEGLNLGRPLVDDVLNLVLNNLRKGARSLDKKPGTAEVLAFLLALYRQGVDRNSGLKSCFQQAMNAAGTLAKNKTDLEKVKKYLKDQFG